MFLNESFTKIMKSITGKRGKYLLKGKHETLAYRSEEEMCKI